MAEEEAKRKEEEKQRRKEEKAKNRAELKRQGLLLTGKEKQEAERLAQMREQFLKNNPGLEFPSGLFDFLVFEVFPFSAGLHASDSRSLTHR